MAPAGVCGSRMVHVQVSVMQIASLIVVLSVLLSARTQRGQGQDTVQHLSLALASVGIGVK